METVNKFIIIPFFIFNIIFCQDYHISISGYHIGDLTKVYTSSNKIKLDLSTRGLFDVFYPTKNSYETTFDSLTYFLKEYEYEIDQTNLKEKVLLKTKDETNNSSNKENYFLLPSNAFNFISFLEYIKTKKKSDIDTKWFPYESGKILGRARVVWADSSNIYYNKDSVMCNHYRLDIEFDDPSEFKELDYLNKHLIQEKNVKELWISIKSSEIYSLKISNSFLSLNLKILPK